MEIAEFGPAMPIGSRHARCFETQRFGAAILTALLLTLAAPALAAPRDSDATAAPGTAAPDPAAVATPRPPHDVPGSGPRVVTSTGSGAGGNSNRPWSIEDALPDRSPAVRRWPVDKPAAELGRVPLRRGQGSLGLETETKVKQNELPDGTQLPGPETSPRRPPSYLGLSISVPTDNRSLLPSFGRED